MTAVSGSMARQTTTAGRRTPDAVIRMWLAPVALVAALGLIVGGRWWATRVGLDAMAVGAAFALALAGLAFAGVRLRGQAVFGGEPATSTRTVLGVAVGAAFGLALVAVVLAGAAIGGAAHVPGLGRPAAPFLPWAVVIVVVATAEEAVLRGRLFDAIWRAGGLVPAVSLTTLAFALMHVPLYGWHVVPLDLAVGLMFAGLRIATGSAVAPGAAHATADVATWWL